MQNEKSTLSAFFFVSTERRRMKSCLLYVKQVFGHTEHMVQSISYNVSMNIQREIAI